MSDSFGLKAANEQIECLPACFPVPQTLIFYRANVGVTKASVNHRVPVGCILRQIGRPGPRTHKPGQWRIVSWPAAGSGAAVTVLQADDALLAGLIALGHFDRFQGPLADDWRSDDRGTGKQRGLNRYRKVTP